MSNNINENTFVGMAYHELSQEGFGLPSIRALRSPTEKELLNSPIVKAAALTAKAYGTKKGYSNGIPASEAEKEAYIAAVIRKRSMTATRDELKTISKNVDFVKVNGVVILKCNCLLSGSQLVVLGFIAAAVGAAMGFAINAVANPIATTAIKNGLKTVLKTGSVGLGKAAAGGTIVGGSVVTGLTLGFVGGKFLEFITKKFIESNKRNDISIFISWVAFKNSAGKVVLKRFCNAIIDPNMYVPGKEDLIVSDETDDVSMTDLVDDETTVDEDAGKDSKPAETTPTPAEEAHNEEASAGGVVAGDNSDDISVEPTSDEASSEAWYGDPAYSLEDACMDCLVNEETTVDEDAGKDSETAEVTPSPAETEHNEEASAGGVATGDNNSDLEVAPVSEEAGSTESFNMDYDEFSTEEFKPVDGVFDIEDL